MVARCKTCPYFQYTYGEAGECHKHAPVASHNRFPTVGDRNWCGEHPDFGKTNSQLRDVTTWDDAEPVVMEVGDDAA